ncbi:MAG TPA: hypothetical protein VIX84_20030 [Acidimicrobiales bacterium]
MVGGAVLSIVMIAVGAILDFAVVESPYQHGFNINTVGVIFMIVGAVGLFLSLLLGLMGGLDYRRRRTVVDDGRGHVVRRDDSYI